MIAGSNYRLPECWSGVLTTDLIKSVVTCAMGYYTDRMGACAALTQHAT